MNMDVLRALRFWKLQVFYAQLRRLRASMHQIQEENWTPWSLNYWECDTCTFLSEHSLQTCSVFCLSEEYVGGKRFCNLHIKLSLACFSYNRVLSVRVSLLLEPQPSRNDSIRFVIDTPLRARFNLLH